MWQFLLCIKYSQVVLSTQKCWLLPLVVRCEQVSKEEKWHYLTFTVSNENFKRVTMPLPGIPEY